MSTDFSEDTLVEQPAIAIFDELGYETANCFYEKIGTSGSTFGRETTEEVVLVPKLRGALEKLNPGLDSEGINLAIEELSRDRSAMSLVQANREVYKLLRDGMKVSFENDEGEETDETVRIIDWHEPENNGFFLASQFWVSGSIYKRRTDLLGFVDGLPLIFIELKKSHGKIEHAYKHNLKDYKQTIPQLFLYNSLIILSNGSQAKVGSMTEGLHRLIVKVVLVFTGLNVEKMGYQAFPSTEDGKPQGGNVEWAVLLYVMMRKLRPNVFHIHSVSRRNERA